MDHPFRSAALGGFNKQDVLSFLEEQAKQSAQAQQSLQQQLEELNRQNEALRREKEDLQIQLAERQRELETARQSRDSLNLQLERVNLDLDAEQDRLEQTRRERDAALAQTEELRPDAQTYREIKERTAGVELDAHRRAQAVLEKAESDAQRTRRQVNQWLQRLGREYETLRSQVEATVSHAASELEKANSCLDQVNRLMGEQETALEGLAQSYNESDRNRVEAPMPIEEE